MRLSRCFLAQSSKNGIFPASNAMEKGASPLPVSAHAYRDKRDRPYYDSARKLRYDEIRFREKGEIDDSTRLNTGEILSEHDAWKISNDPYLSEDGQPIIADEPESDYARIEPDTFRNRKYQRDYGYGDEEFSFGKKYGNMSNKQTSSSGRIASKHPGKALKNKLFGDISVKQLWDGSEYEGNSVYSSSPSYARKSERFSFKKTPYRTSYGPSHRTPHRTPHRPSHGAPYRKEVFKTVFPFHKSDTHYGIHRIGKLRAGKLSYEAVENDDYEAPPLLEHNLDRVLFNPGVHFLKDPRSNVYNFTPYLEKIVSIKDFDFEKIPAYIPSGEDYHLARLAQSEGKRYTASTSSITSILFHFHQLLSHNRRPQIMTTSKQFEGKTTSFSPTQLQPIQVFLRFNEKTRTHAIDSDRSKSEDMIVSVLGHVLESMLTTEESEFESYKKTGKKKAVEEVDREETEGMKEKDTEGMEKTETEKVEGTRETLNETVEAKESTDETVEAQNALDAGKEAQESSDESVRQTVEEKAEGILEMEEVVDETSEIETLPETHEVSSDVADENGEKTSNTTESMEKSDESVEETTKLSNENLEHQTDSNISEHDVESQNLDSSKEELHETTRNSVNENSNGEVAEDDKAQEKSDKSSNIKDALNEESEKYEAAMRSYHYTACGDFLLRSQLDCRDPRLPGSGIFDLKTRAVCAVRHDMDYAQIHDGSHYLIDKLDGSYESFAREWYELIRSTMFKYSLQARIGRMDGIFLAYHNVRRLFGFQYVPLEDMDKIFHTSHLLKKPVIEKLGDDMYIQDRERVEARRAKEYEQLKALSDLKRGEFNRKVKRRLRRQKAELENAVPVNDPPHRLKNDLDTQMNECASLIADAEFKLSVNLLQNILDRIIEDHRLPQQSFCLAFCAVDRKMFVFAKRMTDENIKYIQDNQAEPDFRLEEKPRIGRDANTILKHVIGRKGHDIPDLRVYEIGIRTYINDKLIQFSEHPVIKKKSDEWRVDYRIYELDALESAKAIKRSFATAERFCDVYTTIPQLERLGEEVEKQMREDALKKLAPPSELQKTMRFLSENGRVKQEKEEEENSAKTVWFPRKLNPGSEL